MSISKLVRGKLGEKVVFEHEKTLGNAVFPRVFGMVWVRGFELFTYAKCKETKLKEVRIFKGFEGFMLTYAQSKLRGKNPG